jgi:hypothetical protein
MNGAPPAGGATFFAPTRRRRIVINRRRRQRMVLARVVRATDMGRRRWPGEAGPDPPRGLNSAVRNTERTVVIDGRRMFGDAAKPKGARHASQLQVSLPRGPDPDRARNLRLRPAPNYLKRCATASRLAKPREKLRIASRPAPGDANPPTPIVEKVCRAVAAESHPRPTYPTARSAPRHSCS